MNRLLLVILMTAIPLLLESEPAPFGLVLNKTTVAELKAQYAPIFVGINKNNGMEAYDIPTENIPLEGLISARAAFSKEGILQLFQMSLPSTKFDDMLQGLLKKYTLVYKNAPTYGTKEAKFASDNTYILLYASKEGTDMDFLYINKQIFDQTMLPTNKDGNSGGVAETGTDSVEKSKNDIISML